MQIVIDIDEGLYEWVHRQITDDEGWSEIQATIMDGTPLPKGYGKLIATDAVIKYVSSLPKCPNGYSQTYDEHMIINIIDDIQPIIEEDKAETE